jgi:hypothetical protein
VLTIALVAAATFALLDMFAPSIGQSARLGAGLGVGAWQCPYGPRSINTARPLGIRDLFPVVK